ncbi:tyrosine-type recombinase/integrase [uncultured Anaerococcus sp.]|uniref:site-specific integrase n=1 Tax=uncultured Anaerococcus sp. TaxID=293428 RepID=UPI00288B6731|nr:tyrosine-type recombinase/integrase [uncultured Anaerococcus sp.]
MPAYKDTNTGKWYCKFYYKDNEGKNKQKKKMGFSTKSKALEYEREYLLSRQGQPTMLLSSFIEVYKADQYPNLRERSQLTKDSKYKKILGDFKDKPLNEITPTDLKHWQNKLIKQGYADGYITCLRSEFSSLLNHAVNYYGLPKNPFKLVKRAKNPNYIPQEQNFWTLEEFKQVYKNIDNIKASTAINLLYWAGIRKGELLALTWDKINFEKGTLLVNRSLQRVRGKNVITQTKTYESREITLPTSTIEILKEYKARCYNNKKNDFIFNWEKRFIENGIKNGVNKANEEIEAFNNSHDNKKDLIKRIKVHDLRHSHASYLINHNVNIVLISKRLGHKDTSTTLDTYSHFFPISETNLINLMNKDS